MVIVIILLQSQDKREDMVFSVELGHAGLPFSAVYLCSELNIQTLLCTLLNREFDWRYCSYRARTGPFTAIRIQTVATGRRTNFLL